MSNKPTLSKCSARRTNGEPCGNYPIHGGTVCRIHGGGAPQVKRKAQERIREAASDAAANLVKWMADEAVEMSIRVRVAHDILDRAGVSKNASLMVDVAPRFEQLLAGEGRSAIVVDLDDEDIVDADVVDEGEANATQDLASRDRALTGAQAPVVDVPDDTRPPRRPTMRQRRMQ